MLAFCFSAGLKEREGRRDIHCGYPTAELLPVAYFAPLLSFVRSVTREKEGKNNDDGLCSTYERKNKEWSKKIAEKKVQQAFPLFPESWKKK